MTVGGVAHDVDLQSMPRPKPAIPADAAQLRALQADLADLSVPALLGVRDAVAAALLRERISATDVRAVLAARLPR